MNLAGRASARLPAPASRAKGKGAAGLNKVDVKAPRR